MKTLIVNEIFMKGQYSLTNLSLQLYLLNLISPIIPHETFKMLYFFPFVDLNYYLYYLLFVFTILAPRMNVAMC